MKELAHLIHLLYAMFRVVWVIFITWTFIESYLRWVDGTLYTDIPIILITATVMLGVINIVFNYLYLKSKKLAE